MKAFLIVVGILVGLFARVYHDLGKDDDFK